MKNLPIALALAVLGTTLVASSAQAQRRGFAFSGASRGEGTFGRGPGARGHAGRHGHVRRIFPRAGYAAYYPGFGYDSGFGLNSAYEPTLEVPPPQPAEPSPTVAPTLPPNPADGPVVLELQGDRWFRVTYDGPPQVVGQSYRPEPEKASNSPNVAASAVLVFRDGHKEKIGKYCIIGGAIHISADYWSTGSWNRTVEILDLDVPATLKLNQEQGIQFRLPSGPYEVMIGG